jgi:hypothetical protein
MDFLLWGTENAQNPMNENLRFVCPLVESFGLFTTFGRFSLLKISGFVKERGEQNFRFFSVNSKIINFFFKNLPNF